MDVALFQESVKKDRASLRPRTMCRYTSANEVARKSISTAGGAGDYLRTVHRRELRAYVRKGLDSGAGLQWQAQASKRQAPFRKRSREGLDSSRASSAAGGEHIVEICDCIADSHVPPTDSPRDSESATLSRVERRLPIVMLADVERGVKCAPFLASLPTESRRTLICVGESVSGGGGGNRTSE
jgi:hypothetical protein